MNASQHLLHEDIDPAQQMACGNPFLEIERVEKLSLISSLTSHHGVHPPNHLGKENHDSAYNSTEFFNSIDPKRKSHLMANNPIGGETYLISPKSRHLDFATLSRNVRHLYRSIGPPASFQAAMPPWMWQAEVMPASCAA